MTLAALIDSHCHIVLPNFADDLDEVANRWRNSGVKKLIHACIEPGEISSIRALADRFPEMRYSVGVHPLDTELWREDTVSILRQAALEDSRVVAIGELGLDLYKEKNLNSQLETLKPQLQLAFELNLPVIVHCRDAAKEMLKLLQELDTAGKCPKGVMHCWGGTPEEMKWFLDLGFYISFSGTVTFPKAYQIHQCAKEVPQDRFLVETDCPFLSPVPKRGQRNEPAFVEMVAHRVAEIRNQSFTDIARITSSNAERLFDLS